MMVINDFVVAIADAHWVGFHSAVSSATAISTTVIAIIALVAVATMPVTDCGTGNCTDSSCGDLTVTVSNLASNNSTDNSASHRTAIAAMSALTVIVAALVNGPSTADATVAVFGPEFISLINV